MKNVIKKILTSIKELPRKVKVIGLLVASIILIAILSQKAINKEPGYKTVAVKRATIVEIIDETGTVSTTSKTDVYSPAKGVVEELYVNNEDIVGIDQELFRVTSTATEDEKATALANLLSAQSSLKTAEQLKLTYQTQLEQAREAILDARTASDAFYNQTTSHSQLEKDTIDSAMTSAYYNFNTLEKKYIEADVAISSARASVTKYHLAYESTKDRVVKSPAIGTVSNLSVAMGDTISAYDPTSTAAALGMSSSTPPALTIANFTSNSVTAKISETDILNIEVGQKVTIQPDALKDEEYAGIISRVDDIGTDVQGVVTYNVYINILDSDNKLKSGMTVDVNITTKSADNVLAVPNTAVKPYKGGRAVRFFNEKTKEIDYIPVVVGLKGQELTEIKNGLTEGQRIITTLSNEEVKRGIFGM